MASYRSSNHFFTVRTAVLSSAFFFSLVLSQTAPQNPTISLQYGLLTGKSADVSTESDQPTKVNRYLGIPYAEPPERFGPPVAWTKKMDNGFDGTAAGMSCTQQFLGPDAERNFMANVYNNPAATESENCLNLNVWVPTTNAPDGGFAVMFWLYGGGLQFGSASLPMYDATSFAADQEIIVVAPNYRTNVFGFPGDVEGIPPESRNLGYLDQQMALQWVQDNISKFGGDPKKVTIFGESSGTSTAEMLVLMSPTSPPLFRAAVFASGGAESMGGTTNMTEPSSFSKLATALNCTATDLACVRAAPFERIKSIVERQSLVFGPVQSNATNMAMNPGTNHLGWNSKLPTIPIIMGSNSQESRVFLAAQNNGSTAFEPNFDDLFATLFSANPNKTILDLEANIRTAYPVGVGQDFKTDFDAASQIMTDVTYTCPTSRAARATAALGFPTWRYYFNATFPNIQPFEGAGVYHGSEVPLIFGTYAKDNVTQTQVQLSRFIQSSWADFAKDPTKGPGWSALGAPGGLDVAIIGSTSSGNPTAAAMVKSDDLDRRCNVLENAMGMVAPSTRADDGVIGRLPIFGTY